MKLYNLIFKICTITLILLGLLIIIPCINYADDTESLICYIYKNSSYQGEYITLTSSGEEIESWNYDESRYLLINPTVLNNSSTYYIEVKLSSELYFPGEEINFPSGYESVNFTKNPEISVNGNLLI